MITELAARWLLTVVFAAAGLRAALPRREPARSARPADQVSAVFCSAMCAALIFMTWWSEPAAAIWLQAALFGCAALWPELASLAGSGRVRRPSSYPDSGCHDMDADRDARQYRDAAVLVIQRRDGAHATGCYARLGPRRQHPARGVVRGRVHPVASAGHRPRAPGERPGLGQPGRDERRDGGNAVRDAVTTSPEQACLAGGGDSPTPVRLEPAVAIEDVLQIAAR